MTKRAPTPAEIAVARKSRTVAIVMAATILLWMGAQVLGSRLGLDPRYVFLFDFAAIAAFVWVLIVTVQIWRLQSAAGK
ncbi:MAG: DUF5337 domain-containing protein [Paracoccaceae bacterium]